MFNIIKDKKTKAYDTFYTTSKNLDGFREVFDLSKEDAITFLQNYGCKKIFVGIRYGGCDKLLNDFTI